MSRKKRTVIRSVLLLAALGFIFYGIGRGEVETVFIKAVNICLECIGIG